MRRSNAVVSWSIATAVTSLLTVASLRAGQGPANPPLVSEQYFKNIQLLKGMPLDCHRGDYQPVDTPSFTIQYGVPPDEPNTINFPTEEGVSADQVFDRYLTAIGGRPALARVTSFVARGTYAGFDTGQEEMPVEIYARAPNQRTWIVKLPERDRYRVNGWLAGPDIPVPIMTLASGNLDRARIEATLAFPGGIT